MEFITPNDVTARRKSKRWASCLVALQVIFILLNANAKDEPSATFDWRKHFDNPPIVRNCVFERLLISNDGKSWKTNYFQFRYQTNGFFFRELEKLSDANEEVIPAISAGYFETNAWSIEAGTLKRFLNLDLVKLRNGTYDTSGNSGTIFVSERIAFEALFYGIINLDPQSLQWNGKSAFTGATVYGEKFTGRIDEMSGEWPAKLRLQKEGDPMGQLLEYKYNVHLGIPYFPSEILFFREWQDKKQLRGLQRVFILETSDKLLSPEYFDPSRYFNPSSNTLISEMIFKGNDAFIVEKDGSLSPVEKLDPKAINESRPKPRFFSAFGLVILLTILFFGVWRLIQTRR